MYSPTPASTHPPTHPRTHPPKVVYELESDEREEGTRGWHGSVVRAWINDKNSFPIALCGKSLEFWTIRQPVWEITADKLNFEYTISMVACSRSVDIDCSDFVGHVQCEIKSKDETKSAQYTEIRIIGE